MRHNDTRGAATSADEQGEPVTRNIPIAPGAPQLVRTRPRRTRQARFMAAALAVAQAEVGVIEEPPDSNSGPRVDLYLASVGLGPGYAWCAAFVYWCAEQAAANSGRRDVPLLRTGWTPSVWEDAIHNGRAIPPADVLKGAVQLDPGTLFVLRGAVDGAERVKHVGFVAGSRDGMIETVEGNTDQKGSREGDGVYRGLVSVSMVHGFVVYG